MKSNTNEAEDIVICPDCNKYTLDTPKQLENKRCTRCQRRYMACNSLRTSRGLQPLKYVPIINESKEVKEEFFGRNLIEVDNSNKVDNSIIKDYMKDCILKGYSPVQIVKLLKDNYNYDTTNRKVSMFKYIHKLGNKQLNSFKNRNYFSFTTEEKAILLKLSECGIKYYEELFYIYKNYIAVDINTQLTLFAFRRQLINDCIYCSSFLRGKECKMTEDEYKKFLFEGLEKVKDLRLMVDVDKRVKEILNSYMSNRQEIIKTIKLNDTNFTVAFIEDLEEKAKTKNIIELTEYARNNYPQYDISKERIKSLLMAHNIDYVKMRKNKVKTIKTNEAETDSASKPVNNTYNEQDTKEDEIEKENIVKVVEQIVGKKDNVISEDELKEIEKAKQDVLNTLNRKYKLMMCNIDFTYTIDDIIKALNMFKDLNSHLSEYMGKLRQQYYIINEYQDDIVHEIENESYEDIYLFKKLKSLRTIRRQSKYNSICLNILNKYKKEDIDIETITDIINELKQQKQYEEKPIYIPKVDMDIVDKYDWGQRPSLTSKKVHNPNIRKEIPDTEKLYLVETEISGGGYGVFNKYVRKIQAQSEEEAITFMENILERKKQYNNQIYWTTPIKAKEIDI